MAEDIKIRSYRFSIKTIKYLKSQKWDSLSSIVAKQVMRSAMSVGANVVEAKNSTTRLEFKRYYEIALKSCNETKYWICILRDGFDIKDEELDLLLNEAKEISKILAASVLSLKKSNLVTKSST